ncbi:translation machinery-associated protein 16 [Octopus bimaculoides]|nr:translation machinery-associated protein 16 [Octopus bimaculoides]|eukprot:XP_014768981.1 PREDICTED: translation machinery-associated protein 16-like [Octopus bimaculoides]
MQNAILHSCVPPAHTFNNVSTLKNRSGDVEMLEQRKSASYLFTYQSGGHTSQIDYIFARKHERYAKTFPGEEYTLQHRSKKERISKLNFFIERLQWFKNELENCEGAISLSEQTKLVIKYLERFQDELDQIKIINSIGKRKGVRHASREASIKMTIDMERAQFKGEGLEIPDLLNPDNVSVLKSWDGEYSFIPKIKTTRVSSSKVCMDNIRSSDTKDRNGGDDDKKFSEMSEELDDSKNNDNMLLGDSDDDDDDDYHHNEDDDEDDILASDTE